MLAKEMLAALSTPPKSENRKTIFYAGSASEFYEGAFLVTFGMRVFMKVRQWITGIVLLVLVAAAVVGVVWTRESGSAETQAAGQGSAGSSSAGNGSGASSARRLAASAGTVEEQALAHAAEKTGDHELDLAFFDALRTAEENPPPLSPEA